MTNDSVELLNEYNKGKRDGLNLALEILCDTFGIADEQNKIWMEIKRLENGGTYH